MASDRRNKKEEDLSGLLGGLSLRDAKHRARRNDTISRDTTPCISTKKLQREIDRSGFRIFECISDHGYYSWNPPRNSPYKCLSSVVDATDMTRYLDLDDKPGRLIDPSNLRLPLRFLRSPPPLEHENKFPFSKLDATFLHVATCHRGVDLNDIDFTFGGSTLEMLATRDASDPYMVTSVLTDDPSSPKKDPHRTIMVMKNKDYVQNKNDVGFQFERLMTGHPLDVNDDPTIGSTEHLHVMNVGTYRVMFRAETDATGDGDVPVEIKASNPQYWGTKVMFQMMSSGSVELCHGQKGRGGAFLERVTILSLQEVAIKALGFGSRGTAKAQTLERNIQEGMDSLREQMADVAMGDVFKVTFQADGSLKLLPMRGRSSHIMPAPSIVRDLLGAVKD